MPADTPETKPVLIHVVPKDWAKFQALCGSRKVSKRIRAIVRRELRRAEAKRRNAEPCY